MIDTSALSEVFGGGPGPGVLVPRRSLWENSSGKPKLK